MRRVLGWAIVVLGVLALLLVVLGLVVGLTQDGPDALGGLVLLVVPALLLAVGRIVLAGSSGPRAVASSSHGVDVRDETVYLQRFCQVPLVGTPIAVLLAVAAFWVFALAPFPVQLVPMFAGVVVVVYLVGVVIYLPYAVRVGTRSLTIGVRGVPRFGRGWRRLALPADAVLEWRILDGLRDPGYPRAVDPDTGRRVASAGSMCGPGPGHVLLVRYDRVRVSVPFPAIVLEGYGTRSSAELGVRDTGCLTVLTNRPRRLGRALREALPDREGLTRDPPRRRR